MTTFCLPGEGKSYRLPVRNALARASCLAQESVSALPNLLRIAHAVLPIHKPHVQIQRPACISVPWTDEKLLLDSASGHLTAENSHLLCGVTAINSLCFSGVPPGLRKYVTQVWPDLAHQ